MLRILAEVGHGPAHPNLWNPTILGVLVVVSAIGLFCGSAYLLLATNLGARLGFLVAFASLMGFMVLLSTLWWTSGNSGIDPPHGRSPSWKVIDVVNDVGQAKVKVVQNIARDGRPATDLDVGNLRPAIDAALVAPAPVEGEEPPEQPFQRFDSSLEYLTDFEGYNSYLIGGDASNFFWHKPKFAVAQFCPTKLPTPAGQAPVCDPLQDKSFVVLQYDFGSLRQPVVFQFWIPSVLLFGLSLLCLHWYEQDERKKKKAALVSTPTPSA